MSVERPNSETLINRKVFTLESVPFGARETTLVAGYFDLLHPGHVLFLRRCREIGNPLVVGVRAAELSTKAGRPVMTDEERMTVVSELACVDYVFLDRHRYTRELIDALRPKAVVFSSGERPSQGKQKEIRLLEESFPDVEIAYVPRQSYQISTTQIINRIKNRGNNLDRKAVRQERIKAELEAYSAESNAETKTAALIVGAGGIVLSQGVNYHPEFSGEVEFSNTETLESKQSKPRPVHAELDAILNLMEMGIRDMERFTLYSLKLPCASCAELICRLGFKRVVYFEDFDNNYGELIFGLNGIQLERW